MSEQQKDSNVIGPASTASIPAVPDQDTKVALASTGTESDKPKRRSASRAKAAQDPEDEVGKPKRTRTSHRVAKAKDGQSEAQPDGQKHHEASQPKVGSPALEDVDLPPLPPAPVPTPEGIAFMQQHVAYQEALKKRSALRLERLERPTRTSEDNALPNEREPGASIRPFRTKPDKAEKENSIEAGPHISKEPVSEADLQALHDAEDARLLRQLLERSRALRGPDGGSSNLEQVSTAAQTDIGALHSIKDAVARKLGLAVVAQNRRAGAAYKAEFDKQAPEFRQAVEEVASDQAGASRSAAASKSNQDVTATPVQNAVPESVRKRFLNVDNDYYFPDRSPAFVDRGAKLATRGEHPEVVRALVDIAKERGWNNVTVKGSESFRRAAWIEAARSGMQVAGYKPTELDLAELQQREPNNSIEAGSVRQQGTVPPTSLAKPLEQIADQKLNEKLSAFSNDRPTLVVKKYPELVQAYALLDAARKFAEAHMPGHEAQFVAIGKALITQQLREGREVVGPKVYPEQVSQSRSGRQTAVKSAQDEALVRER